MTATLPSPVQVKLAPIPAAADETARLTAFLSHEELQRGKRLLDEERRRRFLVCRGMLREALSGYLGEAPGKIRLTEGEYGKLHLAGAPGAPPLLFNVSHAGDYLLLVFAAGREVGCDLEQVRPELPFRAMAQRYFSPREREDLFSLPQGEQLAAFYRCWTRKEAYLKGTGTGFSRPCTAFDVSLLPQHPAALLEHRGDAGEVGRWSIADLETPEGYCAALALENRGGLEAGAEGECQAR